MIVGLFKSDKAAEEPTPEPTPEASGKGPQRKNAPTPTRKQAEADRRARLNPTLSPKEAKAREREAKRAERQRAYREFDNSPERQLVRDVVDARFNLGEIAMPLLLSLLVLTMLPIGRGFLDAAMVLTWAFMLALIVDTWLMWRRFKEVAARKLPGISYKGLMFYGFNRQLSFRRWRQPAPRVERGAKL